MEKYLDDAVRAISQSIKFDSSLKEPLDGMPFGKGAADCLAHFLKLADDMGFQTHNFDNYVGEVIFGEKGEEIAVLAHLDVVPAGNGWHRPPFGGQVEKGRIWGRGAMDDKGPAIAALFALKKLKEDGFLPRKRVKLIVGCNEECGWKCIEHYKRVAVLPEVGFSPDANFPVIYAEKGIYHFRVDFPLRNAPFDDFSGGERVNMVCDYATATPNTPIDLERAASLSLRVENGKLVSVGKSAHASTPNEGENAILPLLKYFSLTHIVDCLFTDIYGLKGLHDETGFLTISPDLINYRNGVLSVTCDVRYPATLTSDTVIEKLKLFRAPFETLSHQAPLYQDKNSPLIRVLREVYDEYTNATHEPIAIGGGTYARALKHGAAFGPEIEGEEVTIHQPDEYITIDRVKLMIDVYSEAIKRLTSEE